MSMLLIAILQVRAGKCKNNKDNRSVPMGISVAAVQFGLVQG